MESNLTGNWQSRLLTPRWGQNQLRPADVSEALQAAMLHREAMLEDANYQKVVPNHFVVEVDAHNYAASYQPIETRVLRQWSEKLMEFLVKTNSRMGRREYAFGGRVKVEIRPAVDLAPGAVRIIYRVEPEGAVPVVKGTQPAAPCLVFPPDGRAVTLHPGDMVLGRDPGCDVVLDRPDVAERRLVSGRHATIRLAGDGSFWLFDGAPDGRPSLNGTYINGKRIGTDGARLNDGDLVILAALDPDHPQPETPGVVVFRFVKECR